MLCVKLALFSSRNRLFRVPLSVKRTVPPQLSAAAAYCHGSRFPLYRRTGVLPVPTQPLPLELSFRASPQTGVAIRSPVPAPTGTVLPPCKALFVLRPALLPSLRASAHTGVAIRSPVPAPTGTVLPPCKALFVLRPALLPSLRASAHTGVAIRASAPQARQPCHSEPARRLAWESVLP